MSFEIPPNRWTQAVRGRSGEGKTTLIANEVRELQRLTGMPVCVVIKTTDKAKREETIATYEKQIPKVRIYHGVSSMLFPRIENRIMVIEDFGLYSRVPDFFKQVEDLIKLKARVHKIYTIVATHHSSTKLPTTFDIELDEQDDNKFYQIKEGKNKTSWQNCHIEEGVIGLQKLTSIIGAIQKPVGELGGRRVLGRRGRPIDPNSSRQQFYKMFDSGMLPKDVVKEKKYNSQSREYTRVYTFYTKWKFDKGS